MKRAAVALALTLASPGVASAQTIGPFTPDATLEATVAALPEYRWSMRSSENGAADALAERRLPFAGQDWEVALSRYPGTRYAFSLLTFDAGAKTKDACFRRFADVVAALEPLYGPFGRHPAFARANNTLYGFAFTPSGEAERPTFRLREVGKGSLAREDLAWAGFDTFAEVDLADGEVVAVTASVSGGHPEGHPDVLPGCTLGIDAFQSDERAAKVRALDTP